MNAVVATQRFILINSSFFPTRLTPFREELLLRWVRNQESRISKQHFPFVKSKCQLAAQGYNSARTITYYQSTHSGSRGTTYEQEEPKNNLADKWGTDKTRPYAQQVISAESLGWPGARRGSSRNPFARCGGPQQP
jgi:hypothetical protein